MLRILRILSASLLYGFSFFYSLFIVLDATASTLDNSFEIQVPPPQFVLPNFTGPYQEREASIAPEEYEQAEHLRSLLDAGNHQAVLTELEKFYSIELSPAMLTLQAQIYMTLKQYEKAEATYLTVLKRMPQLIRVHADLGQLYLIQNKPEEARKSFAKAISLGSQDAQIHGQLGYLNLIQFGPFSAISNYQQAAALEPDNHQWQQGLLSALTQARMFEAAQALIGDMLQRQPQNTQLWANQAALHLYQENFRQALISLEIAILFGDNTPQNLKTAARLHLQQGSYDRALALLEQSFDRGGWEAKDLFEYVAWFNQSNLWNKADALLNAIEKNSNQLSTLEQSTYFLLKAQQDIHYNRRAAAEQHFEKSISLNALNGATLIEYAEFLSHDKKFSRSEQLYFRAETLPNSLYDGQLGRANLYLKMLDYQAALTVLRDLSSKFPNQYNIKDNIVIIENIIRTQALLK